MADYKPFFKLCETVRVKIMGGKMGTIRRVPKRRSTGFLFGGDYAYDVSFPDGTPTQRLRETDLTPVAKGW
jgi:hypothetical protein